MTRPARLSRLDGKKGLKRNLFGPRSLSAKIPPLQACEVKVFSLCRQRDNRFRRSGAQSIPLGRGDDWRSR